MKNPVLCLAACIAFTTSSARAASPVDFSPLASLVDNTKQLTAQPSGTAIAVIKASDVLVAVD